MPPRAAWLRVALLELERLYNHVGDVGMIVNDTGFAWGHAHCFRLREELLRLNERLTGHRLLRGAVVPGGVAGSARRGRRSPRRRTTVGRLIADFLEIARVCLDNTLVLERLQGTGRLTIETAREMGVVGLVARASGVDADLRRDAPFAAYGELEVDARRCIRRATCGRAPWSASTRRARPRGSSAGRRRRLPDGRRARRRSRRCPRAATPLSCVEAWRGPVWYWVRAAGPDALRRVKIVDPSFRNWPALELAVLDNIVPDFPLCNKSFNLSYSGSDL